VLCYSNLTENYINTRSVSKDKYIGCLVVKRQNEALVYIESPT